MECPFLSEVEMRSCRLAPVRKLIPLAQVSTGERCSTPEYSACAVYQQHAVELVPSEPPCPHLQQSLMQYCSAAPVSRFVPWSEAALSRCGHGGFRYCDLYLDMISGSKHPIPTGDDIPVPAHLHYTANHFWVDRAEDDICHVGIDAFLARALGRVDRIDFVTPAGNHRPAAVLTAQGHEWQVTFPDRMLIATTNRYLRSDPSRLTTDPYGRGWMFQASGVPLENLMNGVEAKSWIQYETTRLNEFIQKRSGVSADGGVFEPGILIHSNRPDALLMFNEFFSPAAGTGKDIR